MGIIAFLKPFMGMLSDKIGRSKPIFLGLFLSAIGIFLMFYLYIYDNYIDNSFFSIGVSAVTAALTPLASELVEKEYYGITIRALETIKILDSLQGQ